MEKTFLMIKPDAVEKGLIGEIIKRIEGSGLKIVALKMAKASKELAERFYPSDREWFESVGNKSAKSYEEAGLSLKETFGTEDRYEIGKIVKSWLVDFICSGPVVPMIIEGEDAVKKVRKIVGYTDPSCAEKGTIRGDLTNESIKQANLEKRATKNLVHASSDPEEAEREISIWFKDSEIIKS